MVIIKRVKDVYLNDGQSKLLEDLHLLLENGSGGQHQAVEILCDLLSLSHININPNNYLLHHRDGDHSNNKINNLVLIPRGKLLSRYFDDIIGSVDNISIINNIHDKINGINKRNISQTEKINLLQRLAFQCGIINVYASIIFGKLVYLNGYDLLKI